MLAQGAVLIAGAIAALALIVSGFLRRSRTLGAAGLLFLAGAGFASGNSSHRVKSPEADEAHGGPLVKLRAGAAARIDRAFGADAPMARALLIADQNQIPLEIRDRFSRSGLIHMLSISGLHVAIIAGAIALLLQALRVGGRLAFAVQFGAVGFYVLMIGAPAPAVRSAVMVSLLAMSKIIQRPTSPWALLATGALVPLVQPAVARSLGYQLSVAGMAALVASRSVTKRLIEPRVSGWKRTVASELAASCMATIATAPLITWYFGRLSVIAPVSNLAASPVVTILQPTLFLALLLAPVPVAGAIAADAARPMLAAFDGIARAAAAVPGSSVDLSPGFAVATGFAAFSVALLIAAVSRFPRRPLLACAASLGFAAAAPILPRRASGMLELHMLDVGQGDAVLLRTPRGRWILVDAGPAWRGGDAGRSVVVPYVRRRGGELFGFILSHPHNDHVGGASSVITAMRPLHYWDGAYAGGSQSYRASLVTADRMRAQWHRVRPGDGVAVDGVTVRFLGPDSAWTSTLADANEASVIALVTFRSARFLLVGDAERGEEDWLIANAPSLRADVLKVGHHGSSTSSEERFLGHVCPALALISVGARNVYGHPSGDVLAALGRAGARVLRTDSDGTIVVRTDGRRFTASARGVDWEFSPRSSASSPAGDSSCRRRS